MKKAILLLSVFFTYSLFAQQNQLEPGTYKTNQKTGQDVKLVIDDNNKFHITVLSGQLEHQNDSIYLRTQYDNESLFQVEFVTSTTKTKTIKMDFSQNNYYSLYDAYLGIQKINESSPEYKTISDYLGIDENDYEYTDEQEDTNLSFEIEPVAFIYLVNESYKGTTIEKYEVPNGVSEIKVLKRSDLFGKLNLRGKYDPTTKEFTVSEGRTPIVFVKDEPKATTANFVRPIESQQKKMWTYPGKEDRYAAVDTTAVADYDYSGDKPPYVFKLKTEKTLNDALKVAQSSPNKMLVIFYDTNKNAAKDFEKYIKKYENQIQDYMYDQYEPELDEFNFYLATESDKNALKKMDVTDNKTIVFLNSDGTKIYHTKGSMNGYDFSYYNLSNYSTQLQLLNGKVKLDKAIADKKASAPQIQKALLSVVGDQTSDYYEDDYAVALPPPAVVEQYKGGDYDYGTAADSVAVEAVDDYELPEKQNAYQFKSTQDAVALKYKQILDFYQKEKAVNEELVKIITAELSDRGFTQKLFETTNETAKPIDFQSMDYLFQFYKEIEAIRTESYSMQTSQKVINSVCKMLGRPANENQKEKVNEYYDKLLKATNYNSAVYRQRVNLYANSENKSELVNAFDLYFNSIVKPNTNLIEVLDANYQSEKARNWDSYKSDFASLANNTAWYIVENSKDKNEIQKAIQWSEISLKLESNNNYYLDTLAQLYYKNGEKEKAILFEQKAVDAALISDETQVEIYKQVLEKMKNGTY